MALAEHERTPSEAELLTGYEMHEKRTHADTLRELLMPDQELIDECRPALYDAAAQVSATVFDPQAKHAIELYTGIADWFLFAKPRTPLPVGLQLRKSSFYGGSDIEFELDSTFPYLNRTIELAHYRMRTAGLDAVTDRISANLEERRPAIEAVVRDFLMQTNEYAVLAACDQPDPNPKDRSLTLFWRQIREKQEEQLVRKRFGIQHDEHLTTTSPAHSELRRALYRLDDETMKNNKFDHEMDGLERARKLLMPYVVAQLTSTRDSQDIEAKNGFSGARVVYDSTSDIDYPYSGLRVLFDDRNESDILHPYYPGRNFSDDNYVGTPDMQFIAENFAYHAFGILLDPRTDGNLADCLEKVLNVAVESVASDLITSSRVNNSNYGGYENRNSMMLVKQPTAVVTNMLSPNDVHKWHDIFYPNNSPLVTREDYERLVSQKIGEVERYEPANMRVPMRIIMETGNSWESWPTQTGKEDLVLQFTDYRSGSLSIPGFKQVSFDYRGPNFGFIVDPEGDPYAPCEATIGVEKINQLVKTYRDIGLDELATQLEKSPSVTVADLVWHIKSSAVYHLPDGFSKEWDFDVADALDQSRPSFHQLSDYSKIIKDGKLHVQCTTAASFLKHSLQECFEYGQVGEIAGKTIQGSSSVISAAGHVQVIFVHERRVHILDATPPTNVNIQEIYEPLPPAEDYLREQTAATVQPLDIPELTDKQLEYHEPTELSPQEEIEGLYSSLQTQLKVIFNDSRMPEVSKQLIRLANHDPVRRAYETFTRYMTGRITGDQIADAATYLANCSLASEEDRRKLGIGAYTQVFLEQLASMADKLNTLSRQM